MKKYKEIVLGFALLSVGTRAYTQGDLLIIISPPHGESSWHMSISTEHRDPSWYEIRDAWYTLVPDASKINGAMFFPPKDEYVNVQEYCFHVHALPSMQVIL